MKYNKQYDKKPTPSQFFKGFDIVNSLERKHGHKDYWDSLDIAVHPDFGHYFIAADIGFGNTIDITITRRGKARIVRATGVLLDYKLDKNQGE